MKLIEKAKNAWSAFNRDPTASYGAHNDNISNYSFGSTIPYRKNIQRFRSVIDAIYNRIAIDVSLLKVEHSRTDLQGSYYGPIPSRLNSCLTLSANLDQTPNALFQDIVLTMFEKGVVAVVPVDTVEDPYKTESYDIASLRAGTILNWSPTQVEVRLYNENLGQFKDIWLSKQIVAIIENPFFNVMNAPNSIFALLQDKLQALNDKTDGAGKFNMIVQLPFLARTELKKAQVVERMRDLEDQLTKSKYGIGYIDATEKITQLNRALDNTGIDEIKYLTGLAYQQVNISEAILNGTASEQEMINYYNRTIEPVVMVIVQEFKRKWLTKTAITQGQTISVVQTPFKFVPVKELANIADVFSRNEILSSNEMRSVLGFIPRDSERADALENKNMAPPDNYDDGSYEDEPEDY